MCVEGFVKMYVCGGFVMKVFDGVELMVCECEVVIIVGFLGFGKFILFVIFGGLLIFDKGFVYIDDELLFDLDMLVWVKIWVKKIGYIF